MPRNYEVEEINAHYARRHGLRTGLFGDRPYANYGYWPRPGMSIDEACDALTDLMARELGLNQDDHLLECGCGYGASALYLAEKYQPRRIVGIDVTEVRIREGVKLIKEKGLDATVHLQLGDATHLSFADRSFTKVLAIECAFHFNTRADFFREAWRVLSPGGVLVMTDIVPAQDINLGDYSREQVREFLSAESKHICDDNIYGVSTYRALLLGSGFAPIKTYSIKDRVVLQFADHLEQVAQSSPPDAKARRLAVAETFRERFMVGGDYIVVRAERPPS